MTTIRCTYCLGLLLLALGLVSCGSDKDSDTVFGIFTIVDDATVEMDGDISRTTFTDFNEMVAAYPNLQQINMNEVPGSTDDDTNLKVAKLVHDRKMRTHILDNGAIASGGVDFFLAGVQRTMGENTMIGVHSWSDGEKEATDYPPDHIEHQLYINYYVSVGFTQAEAEAFYFYTIHAAPAPSIHYMTAEEIDQYHILKP